MSKKSITLYIVQNAQFDEPGGDLVPFARAFTSLEKATKFIVADYNAFCKSFDDMNTLSKDAWKGLAKTKSWYKSRQIYLLPIRDSELRTIEQALCKYKHQV